LGTEIVLYKSQDQIQISPSYSYLSLYALCKLLCRCFLCWSRSQTREKL